MIRCHGEIDYGHFDGLDPRWHQHVVHMVVDEQPFGFVEAESVVAVSAASVEDACVQGLLY